MTTRFEMYAGRKFENALATWNIGGKKIEIDEMDYTIPKDVMLHFRVPSQKKGFVSPVQSAESLDIPDTVSIHIEVREGRAEIRVDDQATLFLIEQFYRGHGEQMGVTHTGHGEGSVTIAQYPMQGTLSTGPLRGYEVIPAGATFHLQKPLEAEAIIGA